MDCVKVAVRVRPLVPQEVQSGCRTCIDVVPEVQQIITRVKHDRFTFNYVFDSNTPQIEVYESAVKCLVMQLFKGYNVTVLAYGQTGSGKTYSMGTCPTSNNSDVGIIPRAISDMFNLIQNDTEWNFKVRASFLELYNEQLIDLLSENHQIVDLRESSQGICIPGLTQKSTFCAQDVMDCLQQGAQMRTTGSTAMNAQSSRSHAIFTIYIHQTKKNNEDEAMTAKFHLVDLAGSERSKRTKAEGKRFQEGIHINKELFVLGNVISALGDGAPFVNYRDSKLTRLLQDSLGGNALTLMLACISPADSNLDETVNTLRYADRARKIKNKPVINQDPNKQEINRLRREVEDLQLALLSNKGSISCPPEHQNLLEKNKILLEKTKLLSTSLDSALSQTTILLERAALAETARDRIKDILTNLNQKFNNTVEVIDPVQDIEKKETIEALKSVLEELNGAYEKSETERIKFEEELCMKSQSSLYAEDEEHQNNDNDEAMDEDDDREDHVLQQAKLNDEIQELEKNLAWKEALAAKLAVSRSLEASIKPCSEEDIAELKQQIDALNSEKKELEDQLKKTRNSNIDHKLAEQRRIRMKELEEKISALERKIMDQDRIIKVKGQNELKIKNLNNEIMNMKRIKVQLINKMKSESEKFRQARSLKEQEMFKLRQQNRKKDSKLVQMENLYTKQQNVYKRKLEESAAVIKRLKDTLALQKASKEKRTFLGNEEKVNNWVSQEFSAILNSLEAERTLDNLMEDRSLLARELVKLQESLNDPNLEKEERDKINSQIKSLNEDLELRSTQIVDLKQKLQSLESYQDKKTKSRWDCVQTMADAKIALKYVFETANTYLSDFHKDKSAKEAALNELQESYNALLEKLKEKETLLKEENEKIKQIETDYNDKIFVILNRLQNYESDFPDKSSYLPLQNKNSDEQKTVALVDQLQNRIKELETQLEKQSKKKSKSSAKSHNWNAVITPETRKRFYEGEDEDEDESENLDDSQDDPDWRQTPIFRRLQALRSINKVSKSVKRNIDGQPSCGCRGECATKVCTCRKLDATCSGNCKCNDSTCKNKETLTNSPKDNSIEQSASDDSDISFKKPR